MRPDKGEFLVQDPRGFSRHSRSAPRALAAMAAMACLSLSACDRKSEVKHVGWLKVTLDTAYKGNPLHFTAYTECIRRYVPGGPFGSAPSSSPISMSPKSVGQTMPDGSFVAFRMPEVCDRFFGTDPGWQNWPLQSKPFVPLMVWSDRARRPSINEAYVAEEAYAGPHSRLALPVAALEPLVSVPENVALATRRLKRGVILDDVTDDSRVENEIGDAAGTPTLAATVGWPVTVTDQFDNCLTHFRAGILLSPEGCRSTLANVTPFIWDGTRFTADPTRHGIIVFQRSSINMRNAPYYAEGQQLIFPPIRDVDHKNRYIYTIVPAPMSDPTQGI